MDSKLLNSKLMKEPYKFFNPKKINSLNVFIDASNKDSITVEEGKISNIVNLADQGNNAVQSIVLDRPSYNGIDTIVCNESGMVLENPVNMIEGYMVVSNVSGDSTAFNVTDLLGSTDVDRYIFLGTGNQTYTVSLDGRISETGDTNINGHSRFSGGNIIVSDPAGFIPFPNQTEKTIVGFKMDNSMEILYLFAYDLGARKGILDIHEVNLFSSELTNEERTRQEGYLAWKWGIEDKLPVNHPYKRRKP